MPELRWNNPLQRFWIRRNKPGVKQRNLDMDLKPFPTPA